MCCHSPDCVTLHESILADRVPSRSVVSDSLQPQGLQPARLLCPWGCSRQEYWHGLPALLQGIFSTQGSNPGLLHCGQILHHLSHEGSPLSGLALEKFTFYAWTSTLNCLWRGSRNRNRSGIQQWRLTPIRQPTTKDFSPTVLKKWILPTAWEAMNWIFPQMSFWWDYSPGKHLEFSWGSWRRSSLVAQMVKCLPTMQKTQVQSLGREDPLEKEMALQFSCLGNPMDRWAWWATVHGIAKSQIQLRN